MNISKKTYQKELRNLQIELVKSQRHIISYNQRILILFEGRDASGKDGTIKRIIEHLSPRETRARDSMLEQTHCKSSPWIIVNADYKKLARINIIRDILDRLESSEKDKNLQKPDQKIVNLYRKASLHRRDKPA